MNPVQFLQILWERRLLFFSILAGLILVVFVVSLFTPKEYVAEVSLLVDVKGPDLLSAVQSAPQLDAGYLATQIDVIASHNVALKVVDQLHLAEDSTTKGQFGKGPGGEAGLRDVVADRLLEKLLVKPSRESRVINLDYTSSDPRTAARIANAFADSYIETSLELKMDPARHQAGWFDEQLLALRKKWQDAQQRLSLYQQQNNIVGNDAQLDVETAQLADIARQLVTAQSAMYEAQARRKHIGSGDKEVNQAPDGVNSGLLQSMKADVARAEGKLAEIEKHYGKNHPQYLGAAAEVASLRQRLSQELGTANSSIVQSAQIAEQRTNELQAALVKQKARILALKQQYDQLDVLYREVQASQHTYEAAAQRGSEVRLESQLNQSSIAILNPAVPPRKPARPKTLTNVVLAGLLGILLSSGAVLAAELMDRRVRSVADVSDLIGIEVLAQLSLGGRGLSRQRFSFPIGITLVEKSRLLGRASSPGARRP